jgi:hypothetical protein
VPPLPGARHLLDLHDRTGEGALLRSRLRADAYDHARRLPRELARPAQSAHCPPPIAQRSRGANESGRSSSVIRPGPPRRSPAISIVAVPAIETARRPAATAARAASYEAFLRTGKKPERSELVSRAIRQLAASLRT